MQRGETAAKLSSPDLRFGCLVQEEGFLIYDLITLSAVEHVKRNVNELLIEK
jgi:hypothetical protein